MKSEECLDTLNSMKDDFMVANSLTYKRIVFYFTGPMRVPEQRTFR